MTLSVLSQKEIIKFRVVLCFQLYSSYRRFCGIDRFFALHWQRITEQGQYTQKHYTKKSPEALMSLCMLLYSWGSTCHSKNTSLSRTDENRNKWIEIPDVCPLPSLIVTWWTRKTYNLKWNFNRTLTLFKIKPIFFSSFHASFA